MLGWALGAPQCTLPGIGLCLVSPQVSQQEQSPVPGDGHSSGPSANSRQPGEGKDVIVTGKGGQSLGCPLAPPTDRQLINLLVANVKFVQGVPRAAQTQWTLLRFDVHISSHTVLK